MKLYNISNHPSDKWTEGQKQGWDSIVDIPFPNIPTTMTSEEVRGLAYDLFRDIVHDLYNQYKQDKKGRRVQFPTLDRVLVKKLFSSVTFHVAGEWSFFYAFVSIIKSYRGRCVVACSDRQVIETVNEDGTVSKNVTFKFAQWREL